MVSYEIVDFFRVKDIVNYRLKFQVPLSYSGVEIPGCTVKEIYVVANITQKYDEKLHDVRVFPEAKTNLVLPEKPKIICYVQGGPGFPCGVPLSSTAFTKVLLDRGYQILFLDQRGTGLSTPLEVGTFSHLLPQINGELKEEYASRQLKFIVNFRADSIVEDYEFVRKALGIEKWSLLGQSYGGFTSFTYLSKYDTSLKEVLVTGGVPPINFSPDDVHSATYARTRERNEHYYDKYPQDKLKVRNILTYLSKNKVTLPNGGNLSVERFQQLGLLFGASGGTDHIHQLVVKFDYDLSTFGFPTYQILNEVQNDSTFDTNVIYPLFLEAIYCDGTGLGKKLSEWSSDRLRYATENTKFVFSEDSDHEVYFTGEMVYKSLYEDFAELKKFKELAYALHNNKEWSSLYDAKRLYETKVPIVSATYVYDQFVDFDLTRAVKKEVFKGNGNLKQYISSEFFHNGVRADAEKVLGSLFDLLDCEID